MLRHIRLGMLFLSVCYLALGLLLLVVPQTSLPWLCLGVSVAVLLTGIVNLVRYFRADRRSFAAMCTLAGGAMTTALGIYTLLQPASVRLILPIIFGLFILVDGIVRLGSAFGFIRKGGRWGVLALLGLLSGLMGAALIAQGTVGLHIPFIKDIFLFSGILLVVEGALNMGCTIYIGMVRKELADHAAEKEAAEKAAAEKAEAEAAAAAQQAPAQLPAETTAEGTGAPDAAAAPDAAVPLEASTAAADAAPDTAPQDPGKEDPTP